MMLSAHQTAYLPWLGYLHRIDLSDKFVVLDLVQFEKNSYSNRNQIKSPGGKIWLTVPISGRGHLSSNLKELKIVNITSWARKHWKALSFNYSKAPFFRQHAEFFHDVYSREWDSLTDLCVELMSYILRQFEITTPIFKQSDIGVTGRKQELICKLCDEFGADTFLFGDHGRDYVDPEFFHSHGVMPKFHSYEGGAYPQLWGSFIPNLSCVDMMFNVPSDELRERLLLGQHQIQV